jgi:hypothetical protein
MMLIRILLFVIVVFACGGHPNSQGEKLTIEEILKLGMPEFASPRVITLVDFPVEDRENVKRAMKEGNLRFVVEGDFNGDGIKNIAVVGREGGECKAPGVGRKVAPTGIPSGSAVPAPHLEEKLYRGFIAVFSIQDNNKVIREEYVRDAALMNAYIDIEDKEKKKKVIAEIIQKERRGYYDMRGGLAAIILSPSGDEVTAILDVGYWHENVITFSWDSENEIFFLSEG